MIAEIKIIEECKNGTCKVEILFDDRFHKRYLIDKLRKK